MTGDIVEMMGEIQRLEAELAGLRKPDDRWAAFTQDELRLINQALIDSGSSHTDHNWYLQCSKLHKEIVECWVRRTSEPG